MTEPTPLSAAIEALIADSESHVYDEVSDEYGVPVDMLRGALDDAARATVPAAEPHAHGPLTWVREAWRCDTCNAWPVEIGGPSTVPAAWPDHADMSVDEKETP